MTDVKELGRHDALTFDDLYRLEWRSVVGVAYALTGSWAAAEELAQDSFLAAHRKWSTVSSYENPAAWVRRVCANRAVSEFRRRSAEARALLRSRHRPPEAAVLPDGADDFWAEVRALPRRQAQVVVLRYVGDLSVGQIATELGIAEGTVKAHLHTARQTLARRLFSSEEVTS